MNWSAYPEYKESGIEWLGRVPRHWSVDRLKWSVESSQNGIWGSEPDGGTDDIRCVRVADFDRPKFAIHDRDVTYRKVTGSERSGRLLSNGDLILEKSGGGEKNPVGFVVLYNRDEPAVTSNFVARMTLRTGMEPRFWTYLHHWLYASRLTQPSIKQTSGIQNLDQQSYLDERVCFPPAEEQALVADFLDRETSKIDLLIAKQKHLIATLREDRAATITLAVTKGLDPNVEMKAVGDLTSPAHWKQAVPLKRVASVQTGLTLGRSVSPESAVTLPYLRVANVQAGRVDLTQVTTVEIERTEIAKYLLRAGDVLMTEGGDIDKLGRGCLWQGEIDQCLHQNHVFAVRCSSQLDAPFFVYLLDTEPARNYFMLTAKKTTNLASTNSTTLGRFSFALPSFVEQSEIVNFLNTRCAKIDALIAKSTEMVKTLREYRSALITDAVTGKIDIRGVA